MQNAPHFTLLSHFQQLGIHSAHDIHILIAQQFYRKHHPFNSLRNQHVGRTMREHIKASALRAQKSIAI